MIEVPGRTAVRRAVLIAVADRLEVLERAGVQVMRRVAERRGQAARQRGSGLDLPGGSNERGVGAQVWPRVQAALDRGVDTDELVGSLAQVNADVGHSMAELLRRWAPQMLREHRVRDRAMRRRMRAVWGPGLDQLYHVYVGAEEVGATLQRTDHDIQADALLALHARACLVFAEVHALLTAGFPLGAWARTRTLYETAVVATVLSDHGREPATVDLAERFFLHAQVDQARDLELAVQSGKTVDQDDLAAALAARDALVERFGASFAKDYGWARPLFPLLPERGRITFAALDELAQANLARLDYRLGGHHVHTSGWTLFLNTAERAGVTLRLTGNVNIGLVDPAAVALTALLATLRALVYGVQDVPEPMDLVSLHALSEIAAHVIDLLDEAQAVVDQREERLEAQRCGPVTILDTDAG